jgi:hypothetical protein
MKKFKLPDNTSGYDELHISEDGKIWLHGPNGAEQINHTPCKPKKPDRTNIQLDPSRIISLDLAMQQYPSIMSAIEVIPEVSIRYLPEDMEEAQSIYRFVQTHHKTTRYGQP